MWTLREGEPTGMPRITLEGLQRDIIYRLTGDGLELRLTVHKPGRQPVVLAQRLGGDESLTYLPVGVPTLMQLMGWMQSKWFDTRAANPYALFLQDEDVKDNGGLWLMAAIINEEDLPEIVRVGVNIIIDSESPSS